MPAPRRPSSVPGPAILGGPDLALAAAHRYLKALYNPFDEPPARLPDLLSFPTSVSRSTCEFDVTTVANPLTGGYSTQVFVYPQFPGIAPTGTSAITGYRALAVNAYNASGIPSGAFGVTDDIGGPAGSLTTSSQRVRTTALGVRITPTTNLMNLGGQISVQHVPVLYSPINPPTAVTNATLVNAPESEQFDPSDLLNNAVHFTWRPSSYSGSLEFLDTTSSPNGNGSCLVITIDGASAGSYHFEVVAHCEFQPKPSFAGLFVVGRSPGSVADVARIEASLHAKVPSAHRPSAGRRVWNWLRGAGRTVAGAISKIPGPVGTAAGAVDTLLGLF